MFSFLGLRSKDSKKTTSERETDGGFVIVGETLEEQRRKMQNMNASLQSSCSANVIVLPNKSPYATPARPAPPAPPPPAPQQAPPTDPAQATPPGGGGGGALPDLLTDVPFGLAPHILSLMQGGGGVGGGLGGVDAPLSRDLNHNLAGFRYDFTLENSVLCSQ